MFQVTVALLKLAAIFEKKVLQSVFITKKPMVLCC